MVSIANQSGPVAKAGTDTGLLAAVSTPNTIADMNIGGTGGSTTKDMVSPAGVEFESRNEKPGPCTGLISWPQRAAAEALGETKPMDIEALLEAIHTQIKKTQAAQ